ncbi:MAG: aldehyde dehydrogenase family protein [Myxococcales bacterium]|nr:aldehyde dehydrogenase family protein [Myxococcales bacterium]MDH3484513.1 aldehyde dehydrogenase family protein [Myxococcales bacterium]
MAIVEPLADTSEGRRRLGIRSPATREPVGEIVVSRREDVEAAIVKARDAQREWARVTIAERARIVRSTIDILVERRDEVVETIIDETGKTRLEALMMEIVPACDYLNFWSGRAVEELSDEKRKLHGYLRPVKRLIMHYRPLGVIGVITPWNGPFSLAINPTIQAVLAGNAVLLKPSEVAPYSGDWAIKLLREAGVPEGVVQTVHGDGETGAALVNGGVQKISFTGSVSTGKKIAAACAEQLIPYSLELGGKDAMIVCADADLERAAGGAVFNSMLNSGHVCMGVERVYVVESVADELEERIANIVRELRYGAGDDVDVGAVFWDRQLPIIERHIEDAKTKGAEIVVGGEADTTNGLFYKPTFVRNVDHSMELMREETFGPIVSVMRVKDEEEAIRLANDSHYGLSGSVWTRDIQKGIEIAKRMETGSVIINDASMAYGAPEAPFGGMKDSGVGHVNGLGALRSYTHQQPILIHRWAQKRERVWYPHTPKTIEEIDGLIRIIYGTALKKLGFFS